MSVPGGDNKIRKHEVNYIVKENQCFQVAVLVMLAMILFFVVSIQSDTSDQYHDMRKLMVNLQDKIAQTKQEQQLDKEQVGRSDYSKFNQNKVVERVKSLQRKINHIEQISQRTLRQVEQALELIKNFEKKSQQSKNILKSLQELKQTIIEYIKPLGNIASYFM